MSESAAEIRKSAGWCWFALGLVAGELAGVLSLHFLTRPGVQLNWPVVGVALAGVTVLTFVAWRRDVR